MSNQFILQVPSISFQKIIFLLYLPESFIHADAGNSPSLFFLPPMQGFSRNEDDRLLWKGSSQAGFDPLTDTHLKHSIPVAETEMINIFNPIKTLTFSIAYLFAWVFERLSNGKESF